MTRWNITPILKALAVLGVAAFGPAVAAARAQADATQILRTSGSCLSLLAMHDSDFDLRSLPLDEWLNAERTTQIPWDVTLRDPIERMDQRYEVAYSAVVEGKEIDGAAAPHEIVFVSGVRDANNKDLLPPTVDRYIYEKAIPANIDITSTHCVFLKPGQYTYWVAFWDRPSGKYSVFKRSVRIPEIKSNPLPNLDHDLPIAEVPEAIGTDPTLLLAMTGPLTLPVNNKRPVDIQMVSVLSGRDASRSRVARTTDGLVAATSAVSQMKLKAGSLEISFLDITNLRALPQLESPTPDAIAKTVSKTIEDNTIRISALANEKTRPKFLSDYLRERLRQPTDALRILIVASRSYEFEHGSKIEPIEIKPECNCRVYHLEFRPADGAFDDIGKLVRPLRPQSFAISSPADLRKALAKIVEDIEKL